MNLLQYFYQNEFFHVDEIDRIKEGKYYGDKSGGWFFLSGNKGSGDWDMARLIGAPEQGVRYFQEVPKENTVFMIPRLRVGADYGEPQEHLLNLAEYPKKGTISCYVSKARRMFDFLHRDKLSEDYDLVYRKQYTWLCYKGIGIGYVMPIRWSKNAVEVYIEIIPEHRGKGLSLILLKTAVKHLAALNKRIVYLVFEDNVPSLKLVQRAGFEQVGIIDAYGEV